MPHELEHLLRPDERAALDRLRFLLGVAATKEAKVHADLDLLAVSLGYLHRAVRDNNRTLDGIVDAYTSGIEPDPEHHPFAAKVAALRAEHDRLAADVVALKEALQGEYERSMVVARKIVADVAAERDAVRAEVDRLRRAL